MILMKHELRQGWKTLAIWTVSIGFFVAICVFLYPEMKGQMEGINEMFASMGAFTAAFGMDELNFGTFLGFYSVECGNILGLGGAFFASMTAVNMLAKEEKDRTAEFLLAHPIGRIRIIFEKLVAVLIQMILLNAIVFVLAIVSIVLSGETIPWKEIGLLHTSYFLVQLELAGVCFGISAFLRHSGLGIGFGLATAMYFLNIVANISEKAEFLKYITPFGYADGANIIEKAALDGKLILPGMVCAALVILVGFCKYARKDIH